MNINNQKRSVLNFIEGSNPFAKCDKSLIFERFQLKNMKLMKGFSLFIKSWTLLVLTFVFGHAANAVYGRIAQAGDEAGIAFQFSDIKRTPDTRPIHKILIAAGDAATPLSDAFYQAYFLRGEDISDSATQDKLIDEVSQTHASAADARSPEKLAQAQTRLEADLRYGQSIGIDGVPLMIFNSNYSLAGAYPSDILLNAIDAAIQE